MNFKAELNVLMDSLFWVETIILGWSSVQVYIDESQVIISRNIVLFFLKIVFVLALTSVCS